MKQELVSSRRRARVALNLDEHSIAGDPRDFREIEQGSRSSAQRGALVPSVMPSLVAWSTRSATIDALATSKPTPVVPWNCRLRRWFSGKASPNPAAGIRPSTPWTADRRGQRQLIIGDRKTGKTAVCVDTIITGVRLGHSDPKQHGSAACSRDRAEGHTIASVKRALVKGGRWSTPRPAAASDPRASKWLRLHWFGIGQHWMDEGKHVSSCRRPHKQARPTAPICCCCAARRARGIPG